MEPGEYRDQQNLITRPVIALVLELLSPVDVARGITDEQWLALVALLFPTVVNARAQAEALAAAFYGSQNPAGTAPDWEPPEYTAQNLETALSRHRDRFLDPVTQPQAVVAMAATAARHVDQAGREYVIGASGLDEADVRWARYDPYPPSCAFCTLLISRGPVYWSTSSEFKAHDKDTCVAVPVFGDDWPGREQFEAAEAFYIEHAAGEPGAQLKALRKAVAEYGSPL